MSSQFSSYPERLRQFKYDSVNHLIVSELLNDGFPDRPKPLLKWSSRHQTIWVTRSNKGQQNDDLLQPIVIPAPPFLIPDNCMGGLLWMSRRWSSRVTGVVTCHELRDNSSHGHILPSHADVGVCWCRNCHDWSSQGSSWFTLKVQGQRFIIQSKILNSGGQNKEWQQISWE